MSRRTFARLAVAGFCAAVLVGCEDGKEPPDHAKSHQAPSGSAVEPFAAGAPDAVLLLTGGTNAMMEVCNCAGAMPGSLSRRSGLFRSYREAFVHTFALDAGDALWVEPDHPKNEFILRGYSQVEYDALVMGDREWAPDPARMVRIFPSARFPLISTTVAPAGAKAGSLPIQPAVRRELGPLKIAVISDLRRQGLNWLDESRLDQLDVAPVERTAELARQLDDKGYYVILVVHGPELLLEKIVASVPAADLIVQGNTTRPGEKLRTLDGRPVVRPGGYEWVSVVALRRTPEGVKPELRMEQVDHRWTSDKRLVQTYQAYAHIAMSRSLDKERKEGLLYEPSSDCGRCHKKEYVGWLKSPHAHAWETLEEAGRTVDPECLACHTSGFGTVTGFRTVKQTPELVNVNCQDCHRFTTPDHVLESFGGQVTELPYEFPEVTEEVCESCHTPVTDPKFDFEVRKAKLKRIGH